MFLWAGAGVALLAVPAGGEDFGTTNTQALAHFRAALQMPDRPVTVVSFGDSMADSYRSVTYYLMNRLMARFGSAGYSLNNYHNTALWQLENGAANRGPDQYWFCRYVAVPPGGAMWWSNQPNPAGVLADQAGLFYVSHPGGGGFRLRLSTNGAPWATVRTLEGYSAEPQGHFATITLPLDRYRLRVESDAGTNFIIGPSLVATHRAGFHAVFMDWGGIHLGQVTNVPPAIRTPILAGLQPDLLIWHMKEDGSGATSNRMAACETWWRAAAPAGDVIYIGTPWLSTDQTGTTTPDQNRVVRGVAVAHGRVYADLMQPTISYDWLVAQGFIEDGTHLNNAGGQYCANVMWDDLGFFSLGLDLRITLQSVGEQLQLRYTTFPTARYRVEFSPDLTVWTPLWTNPLAAAAFSTNFLPGSARGFYRLHLTPP